MPALPEPAQLVFPNWFAVAGDPGASHWPRPLDWADPDAVRGLIEGLADDIDRWWEGPTEDFTRFAAAVIADLCGLEVRVHPASVVDVIAFVRFLAASAALERRKTGTYVVVFDDGLRVTFYEDDQVAVKALNKLMMKLS